MGFTLREIQATDAFDNDSIGLCSSCIIAAGWIESMQLMATEYVLISFAIPFCATYFQTGILCCCDLGCNCIT